MAGIFICIKDSVFIDPCCGSGHILVYVFDLLWQMYDEKGYARREIPTLILKNNLVGLDVDKRAAQLASFALVMKARSANNRFFNEDYYTAPQVHELRDSHFLERIGYRQQMAELAVFTEAELRAVSKLVDTFRYGKTIGSLIKVPAIDFAAAERAIEKLENEVVATTFNTEFLENGTPLLKALLAQAQAMSAKYDVMITNPPYLGTSAMEPAVKDYAAKNYPNSKADLFAMFMETGFVRPNGFTAMVNMHSWMFLSSYKELRHALLASKAFVTMAHLGARAFESIAGEVVQTTSFVIRHSKATTNGVYFRLVEDSDKETAFVNANRNQTSKRRSITTTKPFSIVPGEPIAYWKGQAFFDAFCGTLLSECYETKKGMFTGDNSYFLKTWYEIDYYKIGTDFRFYNKGGGFRRWYGLNDTVVKYYNDGFEIKNAKGSGNINESYFFKTCLSWNLVSTAPFCCRVVLDKCVMGDAGPICIIHEDDPQFYYLLAYLNSNVCNSFMAVLNPTMNYPSGVVANLPFKKNSSVHEIVSSLSQDNVTLSQADWISYEIAWEFKYHPLVELRSGFAWGDAAPTFLLSNAYNAWKRLCEERFRQLKANEEELNRIFIDIYGLQDELTPEVKDEDVTVRLADKERDIKSLISYLVGLIMGRYSLDVEGLAYAGGDWDASKYRSYQPDDDGIVPIYSGLGMEDGLTARVIRLIKLIYGEDSYRQNIDFIADALGKKSSESSEETLNRYLNEGFYADHLKIYQKRPIYWLFSSGKHSGFKCLVYMHRYNADTLARINGKYFLPESTRLKNELDELLLRISRAEGRDRVRLEKERQKLAAAYNEALEYGQVLDHMANKYIAIDLDDGVKVNYAKFQGVELVTDSGTKVKKDLLSPIK